MAIVNKKQAGTPAHFGQTMVRPGDRTSLKAGGDACAPGNYEGGGNMEPVKDE